MKKRNDIQGLRASESLQDFLVYGETLESNKSGTEKRLVLFGDSHAYALAPMLNSSVVIRNYELENYILPCQIALKDSPNERSDCKLLRQGFLRKIELNKPDLVVMTDNAPGYQVKTGDFDDWKKSLDEILQTIAQNSGQFIFFGTNPYQNRPILDCIFANSEISENCFGYPTTNEKFRKVQMQLTNKHGGIFVDYSQWLCYAEICPAFSGGYPVFRDNQHVSRYFSKKSSKLFDTLLKSQGF